MIPTIDSTVIDGSQSVVTAQERMAATVLKENINLIMWGALMLHILYGTIMGLFSGMVIHEDYKIPKKTSTELESESMPAT
jgi:ribose/xylose/arabinose/galactoside ABC-type transport system permease subunit